MMPRSPKKSKPAAGEPPGSEAVPAPEPHVYTPRKGPSPRTRVVREPAVDAGGTLRRASYLFARRAFPTDAALAEVFPVSPSRVARWKQGHPPDAENARLLRDLGIVVALLDGWLEEEAVPDWLHGANAHLGGRRPVDVVREGRLSEVVRAIEAEKSGAFT